MNAIIPEKHPMKKTDLHDYWSLPISDPLSMVEMFQTRDEWLEKGMYAFVCWEWVLPFVNWIGKRKVLEVMAGAGWLAKALREKDIDIIATDNHSWAEKVKWENVTSVENLNADDAILQYGKERDILIMSWPYMDHHAFDAIKTMHEENPNALIVYIGEDRGGCTANDAFFDHFEEVQNDEFKIVQRKFESWYGLHDKIVLGKYKL